MTKSTARRLALYEISEEELPLSCPMAHMPVTTSHPRVFLPIEESGEVTCPYCSNRFILKKSLQTQGFDTGP